MASLRTPPAPPGQTVEVACRGMAGTLWDRLRRALKTEKRDIDEALEDATQRGNEVLDEKERELAATPEERLRIAQERAERADDEFEALKRKIEGQDP